MRALSGGGGVTDRDRDVDDVLASEACWPPDLDSPSLLKTGGFRLGERRRVPLLRGWLAPC